MTALTERSTHLRFANDIIVLAKVRYYKNCILKLEQCDPEAKLHAVREGRAIAGMSGWSSRVRNNKILIPRPNNHHAP